jgi:hypothetical protein
LMMSFENFPKISRRIWYPLSLGWFGKSPTDWHKISNFYKAAFEMNYVRIFLIYTIVKNSINTWKSSSAQISFPYLNLTKVFFFFAWQPRALLTASRTTMRLPSDTGYHSGDARRRHLSTSSNWVNQERWQKRHLRAVCESLSMWLRCPGLCTWALSTRNRFVVHVLYLFLENRDDCSLT